VRLNLPVYNDAGVRELEQLKPFLWPNDLLMPVSGNVDKPLDRAWLERTLTQLADQYPQRVLVATAGLDHLAQLAEAALPVAGLVYIYEPGFANVPEFSWEAAQTLANLERAAATVHASGFQFAFKPTGRPLFQPYLFKHRWDYGSFAERTDMLLVQTQTYCRKGNFARAVEKLGQGCATQLGKTYTQVTLDRTAPNGVAPETALTCAEASADHGFAGVTAWWSPRSAAEAVTFLRGLRPHL
jgi:hypothetical protein